MVNRRFGLGTALLAIAVLGTAGPMGSVSAAPISSLFMSMETTPLFDADAGVQGEWDIPLANARNGTALTDFDFINIADLNFASPAGSVQWQGNPKVSEDTVGTIAAATFGPGGTFALHGEVYKNFVLQPNPGNLPLITGTVSGFAVQEQEYAPNSLNLVVNSYAVLHPTGGLLVDGTISEMPTDYYLSFSGAEVLQNGSDLESFNEDVQTVDVVLFTLTPVPEPTSIFLLAGMVMLMKGRRS